MDDCHEPCLLERVREDTGAAHERVERAIERRFLDPAGLDRERFRNLLLALLGLYRPLDRRLLAATRWHLPGYDYRPRTDRLERDLDVLGCGEERLTDLPTCRLGAIPALDGVPRLLGCLYVVEGSELGARVIWKRLRDALDGDALEADAFFGTDADRTRTRWRRFHGEFERRLAPGAPLDTAVDAARATFHSYRRWMT